MEFTFLPKSNLRSAAFARYAIKSSFQDEGIAYKHSGFYYIGKNKGNIEKLVKAYKRGYASESLENAKVELNRSLATDKNIIPEVIFCEGHYDLQEMQNFRHFMDSHPTLSKIPFVMDATEITEKKLNQHRKMNLLDEIIFIDEHDEEGLVSKSDFLKKIKSRPIADLPVDTHLKENTWPIQISNLLKRAVDIMVALAVLIIASPIFLLIAIAIKLESKGPIFYVAKRAGKGYKIFNFFKFRTMYVGADAKIAEFKHLNQYSGDSGQVFFKINNDPRITKVGAFLRNTSLDELPQLVNVLIGDMSLVGNRPLPLYEAQALTTDDWATRFMAPAGITGLWQIKKRGKEDMSVEERISLDIYYAEKYNFGYDLWIMANTPTALFQKTNA